jgi:hypothetical protein
LLTPETEAAWQVLREQERFLSGFVLIGGTALALQIHHRYSEDLDLAYAGAKLPRGCVDQVINGLAAEGFKITPNDNLAAMDEATIAGEDLLDFNQDYIVNDRVKLTFFRQPHDVRLVLGGQPVDVFRVAKVDEIFKLKCLVTARRNKSRDWFDLYTLFTKHGYGMNDLRAAFASVGQSQPTDVALTRLCSCKTSAHDEGYAHLTQNPPSPEEMALFFQQELKKNEIELARAALLKTPPRFGEIPPSLEGASS